MNFWWKRERDGLFLVGEREREMDYRKRRKIKIIMRQARAHK